MSLRGQPVRHRWRPRSPGRQRGASGCTAEEFAAGVVDTWQLPIAETSSLERFRAWPETLFEGASELVTTVRGSRRVGCLSNTKTLHWNDQADRFQVDATFDVTYPSHQIGLLKPDRDVFEHVRGRHRAHPRTDLVHRRQQPQRPRRPRGRLDRRARDWCAPGARGPEPARCSTGLTRPQLAITQHAAHGRVADHRVRKRAAVPDAACGRSAERGGRR